MLNQRDVETPADLRLTQILNVAALAQLDDKRLPEGSRAIVLEEDTAAGPEITGHREFVFTKLPAPASPALTFALANGAMGTPTRNAYLSKSGYLWIQWPQYFRVTLTAATPVVVSDVIPFVGSGSASVFNRINWRRLSGTVTADSVAFTPADNQLSIVSAVGDTGNIMVELYHMCNYP